MCKLNVQEQSVRATSAKIISSTKMFLSFQLLFAYNSTQILYGLSFHVFLFQKYLNVSHNELERFPPTTEVWRGTLEKLYLNHNVLDHVGENILTLGWY